MQWLLLLLLLYIIYCSSRAVCSVIASIGWAYSAASFAVSAPLFYRLDERISREDSAAPAHSLFQTVAEALGTGMLILALLDACRLVNGMELRVGANSHLS
jgi:hypothetical protein